VHASIPAREFKELVDLWVSLNRLLIHVIAQVPEEKLKISAAWVFKIDPVFEIDRTLCGVLRGRGGPDSSAFVARRRMFERYTEEARTAIFLARNEAGVLGSSVIEPEHLLLGLLKETRRFFIFYLNRFFATRCSSSCSAVIGKLRNPSTFRSASFPNERLRTAPRKPSAWIIK